MQVFKTFKGIHGHIMSHEAERANGISGMSTPLPSSPVPFFKSPIKESLVYNDAMKRYAQRILPSIDEERNCHNVSC